MARMNNERGNHVSGGHPACRHHRRRRRGALAAGAAAWPTCPEYFTSFTSFCFCYLFFCLRRLERISLSWLMNKRGKTSGRRLHNSFSFTEGGGEEGGGRDAAAHLGESAAAAARWQARQALPTRKVGQQFSRAVFNFLSKQPFEC